MTFCAATAPFDSPWFNGMTLTPNDLCRLGIKARVVRSFPPPAPFGTMKETSPSGYFATEATAGSAEPCANTIPAIITRQTVIRTNFFITFNLSFRRIRTYVQRLKFEFSHMLTPDKLPVKKIICILQDTQ